MRLRLLFQALMVVTLTSPAYAETKLDFWHSYTHQPSGVLHYSFHIANYKRGLFFGSCGPSTRSLQWEYDIDLAGKGPAYEKEQLTITSEGKKVVIASGKITIDPNQRAACIELRVTAGPLTDNFRGNGTHRVVKIKP